MQGGWWKVLAEAGSSTISRWERFLPDCKKSTPLQVFRKFSILLIVLEEILGSVHQLVSQILSLALVCHQQLLSAHQGNASVWNIGSSAGVGGWVGAGGITRLSML